MRWEVLGWLRPLKPLGVIDRLRFEWFFAVGAIATLVLDTTKMVGFFVLFQLDFNLTGFGEPSISDHVVMAGYGLRDTNSATQPDKVVPQKGGGIVVEEGKVKGIIAPLSYHVLRLHV